MLWRINFAACFVHLKLRRECKENDMEVGESKVGIGHVNKVMWSLERGISKEIHKNNGQGLLGTKVSKFSPKNVIWLGHDYPASPAHLGSYDQITQWGYFPQNHFLTPICHVTQLFTPVPIVSQTQIHCSCPVIGPLLLLPNLLLFYYLFEGSSRPYPKQKQFLP